MESSCETGRRFEALKRAVMITALFRHVGKTAKRKQRIERSVRAKSTLHAALDPYHNNGFTRSCCFSFFGLLSHLVPCRKPFSARLLLQVLSVTSISWRKMECARHIAKTEKKDRIEDLVLIVK